MSLSTMARLALVVVASLEAPEDVDVDALDVLALSFSSFLFFFRQSDASCPLFSQ